MKICGKALEVSWWMEPSRGTLSTQCTPSEKYWRPPLGFSEGEPLATSSARPQAKNSLGLRPLGFWPLVWSWMWPWVCLQNIPWGTFNLLPRDYIKYSREPPLGLHSPCYLLAFPTDCPTVQCCVCSMVSTGAVSGTGTGAGSYVVCGVQCAVFCLQHVKI